MKVIDRADCEKPLGRRLSSRALPVVLVFLFYCLVTIAFAYPVVLKLGTAVLGPPGDNLEYVYKVWRSGHLLLQGRSPFVSGDIFAAWSHTPLQDETSVSQLLLAVPLSWLFGPIAAYNVMILISFPLAGLSMFLLVRHLTASSMAGLLAGAIFAFCPYHLTHSMGHLPLVGIYWIPLLLLSVERTLETRCWRWAAVTGLSYALAALSSWYYAYMWAMFGVIYAVVRARQLGYRWLTANALWLSLVAALPVAALVLPMAVATWLTMRLEPLRHGVSAFIIYSASPLDFVSGFPWQAIWGGDVHRFIGSGKAGEHSVYVGLIPLAVAFAGWQRSRVARVYGMIALLGAVIALGPVLKWHGVPLTFSVTRPPAVRAVLQTSITHLARIAHRNVPPGIAELRAVPVPLPALAAIIALPGFGSLRAIARFGLVTVVGVSVLAGFGWARFTTCRRRRTRWIMTGVLIVVILFEFWPRQLVIYEPQPSAAERWLSEQPGSFVIAALPAAENNSPRMLFGSVYHHQRLLGGRATILPSGFEQDMVSLDTLPSPAGLEVLRRADVRYLVTDGNTDVRLQGAPDFTLVWRDDEQSIYRFVPGLYSANTHGRP